jgi:hypothetical protein
MESVAKVLFCIVNTCALTRFSYLLLNKLKKELNMSEMNIFNSVLKYLHYMTFCRKRKILQLNYIQQNNY